MLSTLGRKAIGVWGGFRFVHSRFSFVTSRIIQKKKEWFAERMLYSDPSELTKLSKHWWFHFGRALSEVVMPNDFYKVGPAGDRKLDDVGFNAMARDLGTWTDGCADDLITRSHFNLFYEVGMYLFKGSPRQALDFAMHMVAEPDVKPPRPVDPQLMMNLQAAIERTKKNSFP